MELISARRPADLAALREFSTAYLRRLSPDAAAETSPEELYGEITGVFDLAARRGDRPMIVRVFNPIRAEHGYERDGTVVETNTEDLPFLVDSVTAALDAAGVRVARVMHPVVGLERGADGRIAAVLHPREAAARESIMHFDLDRRLEGDALDELASAIHGVLGDVRRAVLDHPAMADRARRMVQLAGAGAARYPDDEVDETVAFLEWLLQDNFIFLGYREYRIAEDTITVVPGSGLGILADEASSAFARPQPLEDLPPGMRERATRGRPADRLQDQSPVARAPARAAWTTSACGACRPTARSSARRACSASSPPRPTPSRRRRRRCSTASCARSCATRT